MARLVFGLLVLAGLSCGSSAANPRLIRVPLLKRESTASSALGQPLTNYYAEMLVGTPPKPFKMLLDINGREVWLPHHLTMGIVFSRLNYKNGYSKAESNTSLKEPNTVYKFDYEGCELSGKAYRDEVEFKEVTDAADPVRFEQRFLAISSASNDRFTQFKPADGVLAFSPWPLSDTGSELVGLTMKRANLISDNIFALLLNKHEDSDVGGELILGGANPSMYSGDLYFHRVRSPQVWEVKLQGVVLGASTVTDCANVNGFASCTAILATNRNDILGPRPAIMDLLRLLGVKKLDEPFDENTVYEIDCARLASAPPLKFVIDDHVYAIPPESYIKKRLDGLIFKTSTCIVTLMTNWSTNQWQLGSNFLANYYTVFDADRRQVAFGNRA